MQNKGHPSEDGLLSSPSQHPPIVCRRVNLAFDPATADNWCHRRSIRDIFSIISFLLPLGEKYFVRSVQYYYDKIDDPVLKEQVRQFVFQEAMHSKEHARANDVLRQLHPQGHKIETLLGKLQALNRFLFPPSWQLAPTCATEHFTAILSHQLLTDPRVLEGSGHAFAAMWLWHAAEETEHKAVPFDVYRNQVGKGVFAYLRRVAAMLVVTGAFAVLIALAVHWIKKDPQPGGETAPEPDPASGDLRLLRDLIPVKLYFDYFRPSFHPWNNDNAHLVRSWQARYPGFGLAPAEEPV